MFSVVGRPTLSHVGTVHYYQPLVPHAWVEALAVSSYWWNDDLLIVISNYLAKDEL